MAVLITARALGPSEYGSLAVALTIVGIAAVVADGGLGETSVARLTHRPGGLQRFDGRVAPIRLWLGLTVSAIGLVAVVIVHASATAASACIVVVGVPGSIVVTSRVFRARIVADFRAAARWSVANSLALWFGAAVGAVVFRASFPAAVTLVITQSVVGLLGSSEVKWRLPPRRVILSWLRAAAPLLGAAVAVAIYTRSDRLFLAAARGPAAAGIYTAAYNIVMLAAVAGVAFQAGLLPRLLHEHGGEAHTIWRIRALSIAAVGTALAALVWALAPVLVRVLYGDRYALSSDALRWLSPLVALYLLNPFLSAVLLARRKSHAIATISMVALVACLPAYPLLIEHFGVAGAAIVSVLIEFAGTVQAVIWLRASDVRTSLRERPGPAGFHGE